MSSRLSILLIFLLILFAEPAWAQQVTGVFFPSVVGDIQEGPIPFSYERPMEEPYFDGRIIRLKDEIKMSRRPYLKSVTAYANQSLIPIEGQLDTLTTGVEYGFYPGKQTKVELYYLPTLFGTSKLKKPRVFGQEFRVVLRQQPTNRFSYYTQLGIFNTAKASITPAGAALIGGTGMQYVLHDRVRLNAGYRRDILGNTLMSAVGIELPDNNKLVGRVKQNIFFGGIDVRPTRSSFISFLYGGGFVDGHNVRTNPFQQFSIYAAKTLVSKGPGARLQLLLPSYQFLALGYDRDQSEIGTATFVPSSDVAVNVARLTAARAGVTELPRPAGTRRAGVGGYFSPTQFYLNQLRLDAAGRLYKSIYYTIGGGLGTANVNSVLGRLKDTEYFATANASVIARLSKKVRQETGWYYLQNKTTYRRQIFYSQTKYYF